LLVLIWSLGPIYLILLRNSFVTLPSLGFSPITFLAPIAHLFLPCCNCSCHCLALLLPGIVETFHFYAVALCVLLVPSLSAAPSALCPVSICSSLGCCSLFLSTFNCFIVLHSGAELSCASDLHKRRRPKSQNSRQGGVQNKKKSGKGIGKRVACHQVRQVQQQWQHLRQRAASGFWR